MDSAPLLASQDVKIVMLNREGAWRAWGQVRSYVIDALKSTWVAERAQQPEDVLKDCMDEWEFRGVRLARREMWVAIRGGDILAVAFGSVTPHPRCVTYSLPIIGGKELAMWVLPMLEEIEKRGRQFGAVALEGYNRPGWARVAGFDRCGELLIRKLVDE